MTGDGKNANSWDGENRLIRSEPGGIATNGAVLVENNYDYQNRRFKKTVKRLSGRGAGYPMDPSQPGSWNVIETRKYIWDTWNIAAEIVIDDSAGTTNINYNTWGLDLSGSIQGAGGVGGLLAVTKASSSATNAYFAGTDANGNVTAYVDGGGTAVAHYAYSAFGETTAKSGSMADDFTHRFSTKPFDVETGYSKYQQRDYIPPLARWASRDPIEEKGGLNLYCANANDYINGIDLFGWTGLDFSKLPSTCGKCSIKYMEEQGVGGGLTQPARILLGYPNYSQCKCADQQARFRQTYPNSTCSVDVQFDQSPDTMLPGIGITLIAHENKHVKCAADAYDWVLEQIFSKVSKSCCGMDKSDIGKKLANLIVAAAGFKRVACSMEIDYIDYQKSTLKANLDQVTSKQQNAIKAQQSFEEYLIKIDAAAKKWENCQ
jgi:RHS repeat-associated protein